ncbi:uncharacterized protein N7484_001465 [Penicillium longicatenatum]|uniref:uncharacterized protein n=1 Tax=Penicillium longicatenatum TaxID=1561947 RepID=UPI0025488FB5|nr:uncharacterized protein N7484_001465 [Penicillium longicatenatum]KAJ5657816.1 hypothetical protein N7484_001465 [Penicillium longicatenatum]
MAEVIGAISAVIALVETSIKIYDSARRTSNYLRHSKWFNDRSSLFSTPSRHTKAILTREKIQYPKTCVKHWSRSLTLGDANASNLRGIFEETVPGENDTREKRDLKVLRRLGKGNKVEELMLGLTVDVQLIVNYDAMKSANQQQNAELDDIINEMKEQMSMDKRDKSS